MNGVALALELIISLLGKSAEIAALVKLAQSEGRTEFTPEEWKTVVDADDAARNKLAEAIAKAKAVVPPGP